MSFSLEWRSFVQNMSDNRLNSRVAARALACLVLGGAVLILAGLIAKDAWLLSSLLAAVYAGALVYLASNAKMYPKVSLCFICMSIACGLLCCALLVA